MSPQHVSRTCLYWIQEISQHEVSRPCCAKQPSHPPWWPYHMPQNDVGILVESRLLITLEQCMIHPGSDEGTTRALFLPDLWWFGIWGEPVMVSPFSGVGELTVAQWEWNVTMARCRFQLSMGSALFAILALSQCLLEAEGVGTACGVWYCVGVLLTNAHSFLVPTRQPSGMGACHPHCTNTFMTSFTCHQKSKHMFGQIYPEWKEKKNRSKKKKTHYWDGSWLSYHFLFMSKKKVFIFSWIQVQKAQVNGN